MATPGQAKLPSSADRIEALESALRLDSRLQAVEELIREKTSAVRPWWRDARTVTVLATLTAAILPILTWINNAYSSSRESRRLLIEQQERIRQTYLDRVLRPGVTEVEQQRVFELLSMLSSDPEMHQWAKQELKRTTDTIDALPDRRIGISDKGDIVCRLQVESKPPGASVMLVRFNENHAFSTHRRDYSADLRISSRIIYVDDQESWICRPNAGTKLSL